MIIYIDLDGTLCTIVEDAHYMMAKPIIENIAKARRLYDEGHHITIWTARGSTTGIDWRALTIAQLEMWGVPYHTLNIGSKPHYDRYIGDKCTNVEDWK